MDFDEHQIVIVDSTPFHPVDPNWPDQGPDRGKLKIAGTTWQVAGCVLAATDGSELHLGSDIPVRKGTDGWAFLVAHLMEPGAALTPGEVVELHVDAAHRWALSVGHSGCHLASLALNRALAPRWSKEIGADALGAPDFDNVAIASSTITENGSTDTYRLNKSLRRKGFSTEGLDDELAQLSLDVNTTLAGWAATGGAIRIDRDGPLLTDRRYWVATLPDGEASIPCGGTHVNSLAELGVIHVAFGLDEENGTSVLTMTTRCMPA